MKIVDKNFLDRLSIYGKNVIDYDNNPTFNIGEKVEVFDIEYYEEIIDNSVRYLEHNLSTKSRTHRMTITPSFCSPHHKYGPQNNYFSIRYNLFDYSGNCFYKLKFSPYYFKEYDRMELNLGIVFYNSFDIYTIGNYKNVCKEYKNIKYTNLSPSHIYIYSIDNKFYVGGLDTEHIGYRDDIEALKSYAEKMNMKFPLLNMEFNQRGIVKYNKKYKINDIYYASKKEIPLAFVSSYYIKHE